MSARRTGAPGRRLRRWYGEGLPQFLVLLASFTVAGYAGVRLLSGGEWLSVVLWFVGAALVHDLLFVPLYAAADRVLRAAARRGARRPWLAFVRVPAFVSGLLLLVWFPLISGQAERYGPTTGLPAGAFLTHWLLITVALFVASALWWAFRAVRGRRSARKQRPSDSH